jgi:hypothetical protein
VVLLPLPWILFHVGGQVPAISGRQRQQQHLFYSYVALALLSMRSLARLMPAAGGHQKASEWPNNAPRTAGRSFARFFRHPLPTRAISNLRLSMRAALRFKLEWRGLLIAQNVETNVGVTSFSYWAYHFQTFLCYSNKINANPFPGEPFNFNGAIHKFLAQKLDKSLPD